MNLEFIVFYFNNGRKIHCLFDILMKFLKFCQFWKNKIRHKKLN